MRTWKIRTMTPGADRNANFARCVTKNCAEVTAVGKVLRQLKLDELPQLWNIVRGEMAFIGPRPIATPLYVELCEQIPGFQDRTSVRPGLSNVAQVAIEENGEGENLISDWKERFEAERHYLMNRSVGYDLVVICMTMLYVARKALRLLLRICKNTWTKCYIGTVHRILKACPRSIGNRSANESLKSDLRQLRPLTPQTLSQKQ